MTLNIDHKRDKVLNISNTGKQSSILVQFTLQFASRMSSVVSAIQDISNPIPGSKYYPFFSSTWKIGETMIDESPGMRDQRRIQTKPDTRGWRSRYPPNGLRSSISDELFEDATRNYPRWEVLHIFAAATWKRAPDANNRNINFFLGVFIEARCDWDSSLNVVSFALRTRVNLSSGFTPACLNFRKSAAVSTGSCVTKQKTVNGVGNRANVACADYAA